MKPSKLIHIMKIQRLPGFLFLVFGLLAGNIGVADALLDIDGSREKLVNPDINQTEFDWARIDTENFEIISYLGTYTTERFDSRGILGLKMAFHLDNRFFLDVDYGRSSIKGELVPGDGTTAIDDNLIRYDAGIGINLFEGRVYMSNGQALTNEFYFKYAKGKVDIDGLKNDLSSLGLGLRVLHPNDFVSFQGGFSQDSVDADNGLNSSKNLKFFLGMGIYF